MTCAKIERSLRAPRLNVEGREQVDSVRCLKIHQSKKTHLVNEICAVVDLSAHSEVQAIPGAVCGQVSVGEGLDLGHDVQCAGEEKW